MQIIGSATTVMGPHNIAISGNTYLGVLTHANSGSNKTYTFPNATGNVLLDSYFLGYALPSLTSGYLNWTGSAWALSAVGGGSTTDVSTGGPFYPVMATTAGGSAFDTASTKLSFSPGTGTLSTNVLTLSVASSIAAISLTRSDLTNTVTLTQSAANLITSTAQIVLPNDPATALQAATKQYVDALQPSAVAAAVGGWQSYTPTTVNLTLSNGTMVFYYRRIGDSITIRGSIVFGSSTTLGASPLQISIPSGLTIDNTKLPDASGGMLSGSAGIYDSSASSITAATILQYSSSSINLRIGSTNVQAGSPMTFAIGDEITIEEVNVPITTYTANINLVSNFTEYLSCDGTAGVAANTNYNPTTVYGPQGSVIPSVTISSGTSTTVTQYTLTTNTVIKETDLLQIEINTGTGNGWQPIANNPGAIACSYLNGIMIGMIISNSGTNTIVIQFSNAGRNVGNGAIGINNWAGVNGAGWKWRVRKVSNGNFAQGSPSYSQTIGDGVTKVYTITHNLNTTDINVSVWELTGLYRNISGAVDVRTPTVNTITLNFDVVPASNAIRVNIFTMGASLFQTWLSPMTTSGDMMYGSTGGTLTRFAGNTTATKNFLTMTSSVPTFGTIASADIATALTAPGPIGSSSSNTGAFTTLGVGTAQTTLSPFVSYQTILDPAGNCYGLSNTLSAGLTATNSNKAVGHYVVAQTGGSAFSISSLIGGWIDTNNYSTAGTTTALTGLNLGIWNANTGTITTGYGVNLTVTNSSGTIGTLYGFYMGSFTGKATTFYSIYSVDGPAYFGGGVVPIVSSPGWSSTMTLTTKGYSVIRITLGGSPTTLNFSAGYDGQKVALELTQDGSGTRLVTWGTGVVFGTDFTSITLTTTINKTDEITLIYNSTAAVWRIVGFARGY